MPYCLNPACPSPKNSVEDCCTSCGTSLLLGQRYRTLKPIGQGGFGRTFLAVDLSASMKPRCVIKQLYPQQQGVEIQAKASDLFRQEAQQLMTAGQYPSIPTFLDYFEQEGFQYLVQEFIEGQNLAEILATGRLFTESEVKVLLETMLETIDFLHHRKIIHRDIKPANIIQTPNGRFVLVDLGAAKLATGTALGQTGTVIGSAEYVAPEQLRGKAIFASDLYSLGATCVTLLTGMSPFSLFDTSTGSWEWRDYLVQNPVSEPFGKILDRLLIGPTRQRYESAIEVLGDLIKKPEPLKGKTIDPWHLPEEDPKGRHWQWEPLVETEEQTENEQFPFQEAVPTDELGIDKQPPGEVLGKGNDRLRTRLNLTILLFLIGVIVWPTGALIIANLSSEKFTPEAPAPRPSIEQVQTPESIAPRGQYNLSDLIKPNHTRKIKPYKVFNNLPLFSSAVIKSDEEIVLGRSMNKKLSIWNFNLSTGSSNSVQLADADAKDTKFPYQTAINNDYLLYSIFAKDGKEEIKAWDMENNKFTPIAIPNPDPSQRIHLDKSGLIYILSDGHIQIQNILKGGKFQTSKRISLQDTTGYLIPVFTKDLTSIFTMQDSRDIGAISNSSIIVQKDVETGQVISSFSPAAIGIPLIEGGPSDPNLFTISKGKDSQFLVVRTIGGIPGVGTPPVTEKLSKLNPYTRGTPGYSSVDLKQVGLPDASVFHVFDIEAKKVLYSFSRPMISHIAISPDSTTLIVLDNGPRGTKLTVWDVKTGRLLREMNIDEITRIPGNRVLFDFTPDSKKFIIGIAPTDYKGTQLPKDLGSAGIFLWNVDELRNP